MFYNRYKYIDEVVSKQAKFWKVTNFLMTSGHFELMLLAVSFPNKLPVYKYSVIIDIN